MDGVRAAAPGRVQDLLDLKVRLGRRGPGQPDRLVGLADERLGGVRVRVHGDRLHAEGATGREDPTRDLTAIGNEQFPNHHQFASHIRKMP